MNKSQTLTASTERRWLGFFVVLYTLMPFVGPRWHLQPPMVWQGDEPHYLVMLNSLLQDGDFELGNNYVAAHQGGLEAGRALHGRLLNHQTVWFVGNQRVEWGDHHSFDPPGRGPNGSPATATAIEFASDIQGVVERPVHPPGLPWLLAPLLWAFRSTALVEPLAILLIAASGILAMLLFHNLIRGWTVHPASALLVTAAAFFGTPVWHYSRKLFVEEPLTLCVMAGTWFALRRSNGWVAGAFLAVGTLMKPPFLLLALPIAVLFTWRRDARALAGFATMCILAVALTLVSNALLYGSIWRAPQPWQPGNPVEATWGLLFSEERGVFAYAPIMALAVLGWPAFWRRRPLEAAVTLSTVALYFGLMTMWRTWSGGWCYGPRLIVPVMPFAMVGLLGIEETWRRWRGVAVSLGILSVATNAIAAGGWNYVSNQNPYRQLYRELGAKK